MIGTKRKRIREILNIRLDLFIQKGCAAARTAEIARAVGRRKGLFFSLF